MNSVFVEGKTPEHYTWRALSGTESQSQTVPTPKSKYAQDSHILDLFLHFLIPIEGLIEVVLLVRWDGTLKLLQCFHWASAATEEGLDISRSHISSVILSLGCILPGTFSRKVKFQLTHVNVM
jgi:hypothetical protein